jgi:MarR family transcriptional regulator, 2-MHQ and catechol-resistance regulon repressor
MDRETSLKLWVVLTRAYQAVQRHAQADQARSSLSEGEFAVLEVLYHKGPMLLVEVQRRVLVSSGGITYLVDRLVRKGLVERRPCTTDRRAAYAALTREGERLIGGIFPAHAEAIAHATAGLTETEMRQAIRLIKKLGLHAADTAPLAELKSTEADRREEVASRS